MTIHTTRRFVPIAILAVLSATQPARAHASWAAYIFSASCTALEGSTIPIPDQTPEQRRTTTASLDQHARSVGAGLGIPQEVVEIEIGQWRKDIVAGLHDPDPDKSKRNQDHVTRLIGVCPTLLGSRLLDILNRVP